MAKTAIDAPRFDAFWLAPEKLKLILDKASPFYQTRAEEAPDAGLVTSMKRGGFLANQAISVFKDGAELCVLDGRRRTLAAREANRQLVAEGREPLRVAVILKRGTEAELYAVQCAANENRSDVSDVERAKELSKLMQYGKTVEEAGEVLGFNAAKAKRILALLDCAAAVQRAVEAGQIPATAAAQLAKLERKEQLVQLERLVAESGGKRVSVKRTAKAVKVAKGDTSTVEPPSRKEVRALYDFACKHGVTVTDITLDGMAVLRWLLTGEARGCVMKTKAAMIAQAPPVTYSLPAPVEPPVESAPQP